MNLEPLRISIALATWNGERFVLEQLESLARQTYQPYELVVRDDASADLTTTIVREFASRAPFRVQMHTNTQRLGFAENFLAAARACTGDAVAFCDQDDVWREDKLELCVKELDRSEKTELVVHQIAKTDENLTHVWNLVPMKSQSTFIETLGLHAEISRIPGCAMVARKRVLDILSRLWPKQHFRTAHQLPGENILPHDCAVLYVANGMGRIYYIAEPLIKHRSHSSNTASTSPLLIERLKQALATGSSEYKRFAANLHHQKLMYAAMAANTRDPGISTSLNILVQMVSSVATLNQERAMLYEATSFQERTTKYSRMIRGGVYRLGGNVVGRNAPIKDAVFVFFHLFFRERGAEQQRYRDQ